VFASTVKRIGHRAGIEISRYRPVAARRMNLLRHVGVKTVFDVGANQGQYGAGLRSSGYDGTILSFEPLGAAFAKLQARTRFDDAWSVYRLALGDDDGEALLHVASKPGSSSLLPMRREHESGAPGVITTGVETVRVARLDALGLVVPSPILLKLDVQGYEDRVVAGAVETLREVALIECELSLDELYEGQPTFRRMIDLLGDHGFEIIDLDPFFYAKTDGRVLSIDGIFSRASTGDSRSRPQSSTLERIPSLTGWQDVTHDSETGLEASPGVSRRLFGRSRATRSRGSSSGSFALAGRRCLKLFCRV
jgi:FkbM family methyltransferase